MKDPLKTILHPLVTEKITIISETENKYGFVCEDFIRSPIDYRFAFKKRENKWLIAGWWAGD